MLVIELGRFGLYQSSIFDIHLPTILDAASLYPIWRVFPSDLHFLCL